MNAIYTCTSLKPTMSVPSKSAVVGDTHREGGNGLTDILRESHTIQKSVPTDALCTHSASQASLWSSLVTCVVYCLRTRQC